MTRPRRLLRILLLCVVAFTELAPAFSNAPVTIAVVTSRDIAPYRAALKGFETRLRESRTPFRIVEFDVETAGHDPEGFVDRIRAKRPGLILTLGSAATILMSNAVRDIPIVFSLVLPSMGRGSLEELQARNGNITGASMEIPVSTQFRKIIEVLPTAKRVGVLYDPAVTGPLIDLAGKTALLMDLDLVAMPVSSEKDVVQRMQEVGDQVDVLWSVADSTVFTPQGLKHILLSTLRSRIPFVGLSPAFVKAGALVALSCNYEDVGGQSGEIAARILAGESPDRIPIAVPREVSMSLNMNTARQIQIAISDEVKRGAEIFF